ncbi:MAG: ABC transporter permease [Deltaproteobacteria bacterium]|nr:ABC transporter permease [Deltaproteobacteria bacterium]
MAVLAKIAWRNVGRQRRRSLITATAMAVGVAMSMAAIALTDGMYGRLFEGLVRTHLGDVQVHQADWPKRHALNASFPEASTLKALDGLSGAAGIAPRAYGFALVGLGDQAAGVRLAGVDPVREARVSLVHGRMVQGRYLDAKADHEVILGRELAQTLHAQLGDQIVAVTQAADGSLGNDLFRVVGLFSTGAADLDRGTAFLHLKDLQELLVIPDRLHEVALAASARDGADALAAEARQALGGGLEVKTWRQLDPNAATMLSMQDAMAWILLAIVFAVAAFGVLNTMLMAVFERTHELGVLRALGLTPAQVVRMVMLESLMLSVVAGWVGIGLGALLDTYLVRHGLDLSAFVQGFSWAGVSFDPVMRGEIRLDRIWTVAVALVIVAVVSAIWPAVRAARLQPTTAMREG